MKKMLLLGIFTALSAWSYSQTTVDVYTGSGKTGQVIINFAKHVTMNHVNVIHKNLEQREYLGKFKVTQEELSFYYRTSEYPAANFEAILKECGVIFEEDFYIHNTTSTTPKK